MQSLERIYVLAQSYNDEINIRLMRVIGGLGGYLVPINFEELIFLLKSAHKIRENFDGIELLNEYDYFFNNDIRLDENHIFKLMNRISEKIVMPEQIINYFFMRLVGGDKEGIKFLSQREIEIENFFDFKGEKSTLIKNEISLLDSFENKEIYEVESLVDYKNNYMMVMSTIEVLDDGEKLSIGKVETLNNLMISSKEAFLNLNKREYIMIYNLEAEGFRNYFYFKKPELMVNIHKNGSLYTEFNKNNDHVKSSCYYLSADIFAVYYITDSDQMIISTFKEENLDFISNFFEENGFNNYLDYEGEYEIDSSIIYEFVNSNYENFYDFINMI